MKTTDLTSFVRTLENLPEVIVKLPQELELFNDGVISSYYAPFEHVNASAKLVICGITTGFQQAKIALTKARECLHSNLSVADAQKQAKNTASFAGVMRNNLVRMMDSIGLQQTPGIATCAELFDERADLVHCTSALRYPVFRDGENYNGAFNGEAP